MEVGGVSMEEPVSAGETFSHANASLDSKVCKQKCRRFMNIYIWSIFAKKSLFMGFRNRLKVSNLIVRAAILLQPEKGSRMQLLLRKLTQNFQDSLSFAHFEL